MKQRAVQALSTVVLFVLGSPLYAQHTGFQARPISLGTSGGNISDSSSGFCCGGTLGALVSRGGRFYILSNNHVLGLSNVGTVGQDIIQPGLIDQSPVCFPDANDLVADLSEFITIVRSRNANNRADAAIAEIVAGAVRTDGHILEVGCVGTPIAASNGMSVKKSGRTTGLTTGSVVSTNVSILVAYSNSPCSNGGKAARFNGQIRITPGSFSAGGDSGSLIVQNTASSPRSVGLLFAGSSSDTFANPILDALNQPGGACSMVTGSCSAITGSETSTDDWDPAYVDAQASQMFLESYLRSIYSEIPSLLGTGIGMGSPYALEVYVNQNDPHMTDVLDRLPGSINGIDVVMVPIDPPRRF